LVFIFAKQKRAFSRFLSVLKVRFIDFCNLLFQSVFGLFFGYYLQFFTIISPFYFIFFWAFYLFFFGLFFTPFRRRNKRLNTTNTEKKEKGVRKGVNDFK